MSRTAFQTVSPFAALAEAPTGHSALENWLSGQRAVLSLWLDRLIAEGDPDDLISLLHRQAAWLDLIQARRAP